MATVEVEKMDSKFRCGNCGPQTGWVEQDAGQMLSIRELYGRLHNNNYGEVVDAVKQLVSAGPEYFVLLLRALKDPQLQELRKDVFLELSKIGDQALPLAKTVVEYLDARTTTAEVRTGAAYALAKMGKEADSTIHVWMQETPRAAWDSWPGVLFHFIGEDRSVEFVRVALTSDQGERKLWACQTIASEITHPWDALVPTLVEQIPGADEWLRSAAIDALVGIGESAVEAMWEMTQARRADVRAVGLTALARYATHSPHLLRPIDEGGRDALAQLSSKLADPEPEVRVAAAVALQQVAVAVANDRLRMEMETADREVQIAIAKGVQRCVVDRHGLAALCDAIHSRIAEPDKHPFAGRRIAAAYLATSPDAYADESSPVLAGLCDWHDPWRREYLEAICLAGIRAKTSQPGILICTAADPSIQVLALAALGSFGEHATDEAVDRAIECLASSHPEVREAAANALGNFGSVNRTAMFSVLKLLEDDSRQVARAACGALGKMKKLAADTVPEIVAAVDRLGETAVLALGRIGTDEARASVLRIYQQLSRSGDESKQSIGDEARAWCEKWEMLPPTSGQDRRGNDNTL